MAFPHPLPELPDVQKNNQNIENDLKVITFGCRLNAQESDMILSQAIDEGLNHSIIFNSCAVTAEASRQLRQAIRRARRLNPEARLVVTGCAAEIDKSSLITMPEIDAILPNSQKTRPGVYRPDVLFSQTAEAFTPGYSKTQVAFAEKPKGGAAGYSSRPILRARSYVAVQNGCDHSCTFCIIPLGRGRSRSTALGDVITAIRQKLAEGAGEVILTGVDITSWGQDLAGQPKLGSLISHILQLVPELPRLRLSSIDGGEVDEDLVRCFAENPRLMPYLHLSLQSGDDLILKRMKRRHNRQSILDLIARLRHLRPDMAFGADLIAGFPTETETMFQNSLSLIADARLAYVHVFPFSPRPDTPAARMPQLTPAVVKERAARLREMAHLSLVKHLKAQKGQVIEGLIEEPGQARAKDFSLIRFMPDPKHKAGAFADFLITDHEKGYLKGETIDTVTEKTLYPPVA